MATRRPLPELHHLTLVLFQSYITQLSSCRSQSVSHHRCPNPNISVLLLPSSRALVSMHAHPFPLVLYLCRCLRPRNTISPVASHSYIFPAVVSAEFCCHSLLGSIVSGFGVSWPTNRPAQRHQLHLLAFSKMFALLLLLRHGGLDRLRNSFLHVMRGVAA